MATLTQLFCWQHCEKFTPIVYISRKQSAQHPLSISLSLSVGRNNNSSSISITTKREFESVHVREQRERERAEPKQRVGRCQCVRSLWHTQTKTLAERSKALRRCLSRVCVSLSLSLLSPFRCGYGLRALISCGCCAANLQENLSSFTVGFVGQVVKNDATCRGAQRRRRATLIYCQEVATTRGNVR